VATTIEVLNENNLYLFACLISFQLEVDRLVVDDDTDGILRSNEIVFYS
jgi:hypothetical protein